MTYLSKLSFRLALQVALMAGSSIYADYYSQPTNQSSQSTYYQNANQQRNTSYGYSNPNARDNGQYNNQNTQKNSQNTSNQQTQNKNRRYEEREEIAQADRYQDASLYRQTRMGDWDYKENWRYDKDAFYRGETQAQAYREEYPDGRGGIGYDPDYSYLRNHPNYARHYTDRHAGYADYYNNAPGQTYYSNYPYTTTPDYYYNDTRSGYSRGSVNLPPNPSTGQVYSTYPYSTSRELGDRNPYNIDRNYGPSRYRR